MPERGVRGRLATGAAWAVPLLLTGLGAAYAIRNASNAEASPVLGAIGQLSESPTVWVHLPEFGNAESRGQVSGAALGLLDEWRGYGIEVMLGGPAPSTVGAVLLAGWLPTDPEGWRTLGLALDGVDVRTPDGRLWPRTEVAVGLTMTRAQWEQASGRLDWLGSAEVPDTSSGTVTWVLGAEGTAAPVAAALEALALRRPPIQPSFVLWSNGQRVYGAELTREGKVRPDGRSFGSGPSGALANERYHDLRKRAERVATAVRGLGPDRSNESGVSLPDVFEASGVAARARDGAVQRSGWYDVAEHRLVVLKGVPGSADDALFAWTQAELRQALGPCVTPWFGRGIAYAFTGRAAGWSLVEIEARAGEVTLDEVLDPMQGRTWVTLAPAQARLARCVLTEFESKVAAAWAVDLAADADLMARVRANWIESQTQSPVGQPTRAARPMGAGVIVEWSASAGVYSGTTARSELKRIADAGFYGVQFEVHVPVAPAGLAERNERPLGQQGWGRNVTTEGDGALLACAAAARAVGLEVVLAPRFITSASSSHGRLQIHGSPERVRLYGDRRALAMEGVAWLGEQMGAAAIVMLDPGDLPRAEGDTDRFYTPEFMAAQASTRRQSMVYSEPFTGERIAFVRGLGTVQSALADSTTVPPGAGDGSAALRIGLEAIEGTTASVDSLAKRLGVVIREFGGRCFAVRAVGRAPVVALPTNTNGPRVFFVGPWFRGRRGGDWQGLRDQSDEELQRVAAWPRK